jgi:RimJ/RimL family protein N-acetyltransferase
METTYTTKKGRSVSIRPLSPNDFEDLLRFANDLIGEDTFVMLSGGEISREEEKAYMDMSLSQMEKGQKIHLVVQYGGNLVGSGEVRIGSKRKSHVGEIGISLASQYREEGIGTLLLKELIEEAKKHGLKLLYLHCFEINARARHLYEKLGFTLSGITPAVYQYKNEYVGEATYFMIL